MSIMDGQTAIVTGAGRGIGVSIAKELASCGANIVVNYSTSEEPAKALVEEMTKEYGGSHIAVHADVSKHDQASSLIASAMEKFGRIDVMVNNAGITRDKTLKNMSFEMWEEVIRVNLNSVFNCTQAVLPHMLQREYGRIISISSFVALAGNVGQANYAATKSGIIGFSKSVALEVAKKGITVNVVCPGFTETDMLWQVPENIRARILERIPMGRFGTAEEIAKCVRYIAAEAPYMTAQAISINGGVYI